MTRSSLRALAVLGTLLATGLPLCAPESGAQVDTSKPIRIKEAKPKVVKFRGEVMNANPVQITVRSRQDERVIRTFTYSPKARDHMQQVLDRGGYQYGDKVEIQHEAGSDVALLIKGRPSKPL